MSYIFNVFMWLFLLVTIILGSIFTLYNPQIVQINYVLDTLDTRLVWALWFSLVLGVILGVSFSLNWALRLSLKNRRLQRAQQQAAAEIEQLTQKINAPPNH